MAQKSHIPDGAVKDFCKNIKHKIKKKKYKDYGPGEEKYFLRDVRQAFDTARGDGNNGYIYAKCKELHQSPYVTYNGMKKYQRNKVELADLMFVFTYYLNGKVVSRQVHLSQSKCVENVTKSHLRWKVDRAQYELLADRPKFELTKTGASKKHELDGVNSSLFTHSFASNVHRPFFHTGGNLGEMLDKKTNYHNFYYGKNSPSGARYLYPVTRRTLDQRYGCQFSKGEDVCDLVEDIYSFGKLTKSRSPNKLQPRSDGGDQRQSGLSIVNIEVDGDREVVGETDDLNEEELTEHLQSRFEERTQEGLNFYAL